MPTTQTTYTRRDLSDDATETLQIVTLAGDYAVQVTRGTPDEDGDLVGLYDIDGEQIPLGDRREWTIPDDVPQEIADRVATEWEIGTTVVEAWTKGG